MRQARVFIDGSAGTTGLRIMQRLRTRPDIELISLPDALRKDINARTQALNSCDVAILCLPDQAAREAANLTTNPHTIIIDASTAHRTAPGWVYGFPEIHGLREKISQATRIANPGCHASGFIALVAPLIEAGILAPSAALTCFTITGYSGGGKKMIAQYEAYEAEAGNSPAEVRASLASDPLASAANASRVAGPIADTGNTTNQLLAAPRAYALTQHHKHIPEMMAVTGLTSAPTFTPIVGNFYAGLEVTIPLPGGLVEASLADLRALYCDYYANEPLITCQQLSEEGGFLSAGAYAGRDDMHIGVYGDDRPEAAHCPGQPLTLVARFDNLGKGASGAAIQNLNCALGLPETTGLHISSGARGA